MNEEICSDCGHKMKKQKLNTPYNESLVWCVNKKCPIVIRFEDSRRIFDEIHSEGDCGL